MMNFYRRFIYDNFLRPSRLVLYDDYIGKIVKAGYEFHTIESLNSDMTKKGMKEYTHKKVCVIRHDIDTDPKTAVELAKIENKYGIKSTFYFRWRTADGECINAISKMGNEVSYHYEELGTYSICHRLKTKAQVDSHINEIRTTFLDNLLLFRRKYGVDCSTIAAHGDWCCANYLHISNNYLIDNDVRIKGNIALEAYDSSFMDNVTCRISDLGGRDIWRPTSLQDAIDNNEPFLYILVHPRQWYTRIRENVIEDCSRLVETIKYRFL